MSTKSKKTRLVEALALVRSWLHAGDPVTSGNELIEDFDLVVGCRCPCGSKVLHQITLASTADCARCGRTIGIRSIVYYRRPDELPVPVVSIGYLWSETKLAARAAVGGVH